MCHSRIRRPSDLGKGLNLLEWPAQSVAIPWLFCQRDQESALILAIDAFETSPVLVRYAECIIRGRFREANIGLDPLTLNPTAFAILIAGQ